VTTALRLSFGYRPLLPWISYRAQHIIRRMMAPDWVVLEFGSGTSTVWFAQRSATLHSIEDDQAWYNTVQGLLVAKQTFNVHHLLRDEATYCDLSDYPDHSFDFVLIDGIQRAACARSVIPKVKAGGWIYLDNSDRYQQATQILLDSADLNNGTVEYFTDFVPTSFVVNQGLLIQL
jgi:predicted O-methyltransferase YrrM